MLTIDEATPDDVPTLLRFIRELAEYEKALDEVESTEADLTRELFEGRPSAFALVARLDGMSVGFALYFFNFST